MGIAGTTEGRRPIDRLRVPSRRWRLWQREKIAKKIQTRHMETGNLETERRMANDGMGTKIIKIGILE